MNPTPNEEPRLGRLLRDDLRRGDFRHSLRREFNELKEFYLDENRKKRLGEMGALRRWFKMSFWLLKSLFLKLTPTRRVLLVLGIIFIAMRADIQTSDGNLVFHNDLTVVGLLVILFVLMLELKDKLLARDELMAGNALQKALMPELKPQVPGWELWLFTRPANEVGGDLLDFMKISDQRYCAALGDVAGKGLRAALLMAKLQATLRALFTETARLAELGSRMNEIFFRDRIPNTFASLVCVELKAGAEGLRILNAGHMPPLILKGLTVEELPKGGPGLGIFQNAAYTEQGCNLKQGEVLIVYSDGLTDARSEAGEFFSDRRLVGLLPTIAGLSCEAAGEKILAEVERFTGEAPNHDDLSLIILRRTAVSGA